MSQVPFPPPSDLSEPGIDPHLWCLLHLLHWQVDSLPTETPGKPLIREGGDTKNKICTSIIVQKTNEEGTKLLIIRFRKKLMTSEM